ncbi:MAG: zinc-binding dehydrogenase [Novosphingobium sp.]|nr:zinc-binding dehydrogenase [Novosphingobium sp.]
MKALVVVEDGRFAPRDMAGPQAAPGQLLVRVKASAISPRDLRLARQKSGFRPGADFAGIVEQAAGRHGPQTGDRVAGVIPNGAWSEQIAVSPRSVSPIPDGMDFAEAAAIAATGLTALYALERAGGLIGRRVLVTAAGGGVGRLACLIAAAGGARVTGWVRSDAAAAPLAACGIPVIAGETVAAARAAGPFDAIIDMAGGETLAIAAGMLAAGGRCVVVGNASGAPTVIDAAELYMNRRELCGFALFPELETKPAAEGLPRLFALWEKGAVTVPDISPVDAMAFSDPAGLPPGKCVLVFD